MLKASPAKEMGIRSLRASLRVECEHDLLRNMGAVGEGTRLDIWTGFLWQRERGCGDYSQIPVNTSDTTSNGADRAAEGKHSTGSDAWEKHRRKGSIQCCALGTLAKKVSVDKWEWGGLQKTTQECLWPGERREKQLVMTGRSASVIGFNNWKQCRWPERRETEAKVISSVYQKNLQIVKTKTNAQREKWAKYFTERETENANEDMKYCLVH